MLPPSPPTDPDVQNYRIRFFMSEVCSGRNPPLTRWIEVRARLATTCTRPARLSMALRGRFVGLSVPSRVARQWFSTHDASLPSAGSRWAQFPGVSSTMKALRLPAPHGPLAHGVRDQAPRLSPRFVLAEALPLGRSDRAGRDQLITRRSSVSGVLSRGRRRVLPGSLTILPIPLPSSRTPVGPPLQSHYSRRVLPPQRRKRGLRRLERFRGLPLGFSTCCLRFKREWAPARLASGWSASLYRAGVEPAGPLQ